MTWRVGNHQPRNIYFGDAFIAVAVGDDDEAAEFARLICAALNKAAAEAEKADRTPIANPTQT